MEVEGCFGNPELVCAVDLLGQGLVAKFLSSSPSVLTCEMGGWTKLPLRASCSDPGGKRHCSVPVVGDMSLGLRGEAALLGSLCPTRRLHVSPA